MINLRKVISTAVLATVAMMMVGCNELVPQGKVAKVLGPKGFYPEVHSPGVVYINDDMLTFKKK